MGKMMLLLVCLTMLVFANCQRQVQSENTFAVDTVLQELKTSGKMRGNIAPFMKMEIGTVELAAGTAVRFDLTVDQPDAIFRFLLTDTETGRFSEETVTGSGSVTLTIAEGGNYILTLANLSGLDVYFSIDYDFGGTLI